MSLLLRGFVYRGLKDGRGRFVMPVLLSRYSEVGVGFTRSSRRAVCRGKGTVALSCSSFIGVVHPGARVTVGLFGGVVGGYGSLRLRVSGMFLGKKDSHLELMGGAIRVSLPKAGACFFNNSSLTITVKTLLCSSNLQIVSAPGGEVTRIACGSPVLATRVGGFGGAWV